MHLRLHIYIEILFYPQTVLERTGEIRRNPFYSLNDDRPIFYLVGLHYPLHFDFGGKTVAAKLSITMYPTSYQIFCVD